MHNKLHANFKGAPIRKSLPLRPTSSTQVERRSLWLSNVSQYFVGYQLSSSLTEAEDKVENEVVYPSRYLPKLAK